MKSTLRTNSLLRTFIAVEIDRPACDWQSASSQAEALIRQLREALAADTGVSIKWVDRENLHFTLKFLGDVPATDTPKILQAIAQAVSQSHPFDLAIYGAGAFPDLHRPRTIWLGVRGGLELMVALQQQIESALKKLHFPSEGRKFVPHLTIGRVLRHSPHDETLRHLLQKHADDKIGQTQVAEVVLFASHLGRGGPIYEVLGRIPLGNPSCNLE